MQKVLMVLGAGKNEVPAIKKAKDMGIRTVVCDMDKDAPGLQCGDFNVTAKTKDPAEYLDIARRYKINGVMTVSVESLVRTVSVIAKELGLPAITEQAAANATNKVLMKKALKEHGIPSARFVSASSLKEARLKAAALKFPQVIKPVDRAGSRGVFKVEDIQGLSDVFDASIREARSGEVIIEEFIDGIESTIDSVTYRGRTSILGISDKEKVHTPNIIAMDLTFPPRYSEEMQERVKKVVDDALKALSVDFGPSHVEVIVNENGPSVIEVAARAGGGLIPSDILPHLVGFDVMEKYIKLALGEDPGIPDYTLGDSVTLRFFKAPTSGVLRRISGVEKARKMENVLKIDFIIKEGDRLNVLKEDNDRVGFVIAKGKNRSEAARTADMVEGAIKFHIK